MKSDWTTKALLAFVGSGLWAVALAHWAPVGTVEAADRKRVQNVVTARLLQVVDLKGDTRIELDALDRDPKIRLYDTDHAVRATLSVTPDDSTIRFSDGDGKERAVMGTAYPIGTIPTESKTAPSVLRLLDADGKVVYQAPR